MSVSLIRRAASAARCCVWLWWMMATVMTGRTAAWLSAVAAHVAKGNCCATNNWTAIF